MTSRPALEWRNLLLTSVFRPKEAKFCLKDIFSSQLSLISLGSAFTLKCFFYDACLFLFHVFAANYKAGTEAVGAPDLSETENLRIRIEHKQCEAMRGWARGIERDGNTHTPQHIEYLQGELAGGGYDEAAEAIDDTRRRAGVLMFIAYAQAGAGDPAAALAALRDVQAWWGLASAARPAAHVLRINRTERNERASLTVRRRHRFQT